MGSKGIILIAVCYWLLAPRIYLLQNRRRNLLSVGILWTILSDLFRFMGIKLPLFLLAWLVLPFSQLLLHFNVRHLLLLPMYFRIFCHINCGTDIVILFFILNPLWYQHVFYPLIRGLNVLFWHLVLIFKQFGIILAALLHREIFGLCLWVVRSVISLNVDSLMFFPKYCWHGLYFLLLLGNTSDCVGSFRTTVVIYYWTQSFLKYLVQVTLCIVHLLFMNFWT